mmetsp:Transcript_14570/g.47487  ORF Transcript_14570/g.47487 Transcript_14570/m.47487 type:complete len:442 (-) Transcript_14570:1337-2662(-)
MTSSPSVSSLATARCSSWRHRWCVQSSRATKISPLLTRWGPRCPITTRSGRPLHRLVFRPTRSRGPGRPPSPRGRSSRSTTRVSSGCASRARSAPALSTVASTSAPRRSSEWTIDAFSRATPPTSSPRPRTPPSRPFSSSRGWPPSPRTTHSGMCPSRRLFRSRRPLARRLRCQSPPRPHPRWPHRRTLRCCADHSRCLVGWHRRSPVEMARPRPTSASSGSLAQSPPSPSSCERHRCRGRRCRCRSRRNQARSSRQKTSSSKSTRRWSRFQQVPSLRSHTPRKHCSSSTTLGRCPALCFSRTPHRLPCQPSGPRKTSEMRRRLWRLRRRRSGYGRKKRRGARQRGRLLRQRRRRRRRRRRQRRRKRRRKRQRQRQRLWRRRLRQPRLWWRGKLRQPTWRRRRSRRRLRPLSRLRHSRPSLSTAPRLRRARRSGRSPSRRL